jgi:hypothetical protein
MSVDTVLADSEPLLAVVHELGNQQIETALRLAAERDGALERARLAEADAAGLLRVNLELQRHLTEYGDDRRSYLDRIAELEEQNERLRGIATLEMPTYQRTRRGWRRKH